MKISLQQVIIGIGIIMLMTFLFIKTNVIESNTHNNFSLHLRHLKELDATLDKDILESRYGLLTTYDLLITETDEFTHLQTELKNVPGFLESDKQEKINKLLNDFSDLQNQKERLIERFKSRNAIINNSLRYFPVATADLIKKVPATSPEQKELEPLNYLLRDILTFYLLINTELEPAIKNHIEILQQREKDKFSTISKSDLEIPLSHARTILKLKPEVDELVRQIVSLPTANKVEELIKLYNSYYDESLRRADTYRLLLYIFSVFMLAYIAFIIVKLKKATSALNIVNENLEQRVEARTEELLWSNADLQKSEANNRALLHAMPDSMWRIDRDGVFLDFIPAKSEKTIVLTGEWLGKTIFEVLPADVAQKTIHFAEKSLKTGDTQIFEYQLSSEDKIHHYESRVLVCGESEILTIVRDITERKFLEEKLQRGQKLESIGQLAAGIAHEINTPTQYVGDNVRFLKDSFVDFNSVLEKNSQMLELCRAQNVIPEFVTEMQAAIKHADVEYLTEEVPKAIEQALVGIGRISKIVQSMKDFAHPGSTDKKATDLNKAIESTITVASNEWKYVAAMVTDYDQNLPPVSCLVGEFNQVVLNMIVNAAHAISEVIGDGSQGKGTISISTKQKGEWVEIRISDTGAGMGEEIRQKIFDPFFTTKEVGKGTGQGLAISHTVIVEKHKGKIDVESQPGKGTTFVICLPINEMTD